jgi:mannose-1-phosphate guanylyltransferase
LFGRPITVTNAHYRFLVAEQLAAIGVEADILLEPVRRDSGPAIVAGAVYALQRGDDPLIVALAADHVVSDPLAFAKVCATAGEAAQDDRIVMFGVEPTRAATDYGYIRPGPPLAPGLFAIERFVEKPDAESAARYVAEGYCGTPATSCFARTFCFRNIAGSSRTAAPPLKQRSKEPARISALSHSSLKLSRAPLPNPSTMR